MLEITSAAVAAFVRLFSSEDRDIGPYLAADIELRPPTYGKSWVGKVLVEQLVLFAAEEFGTLHYNLLWQDSNSYVLRFEGKVGGKAVSGVDIVHLNEAGEIAMIEIFARPPELMLEFRNNMNLRIRNNPAVLKAMGL